MKTESHAMMHGRRVLDQLLDECCPGFKLQNWSSANETLSERTKNFTQSSTVSNIQGRYLAEEICFDSFQPDQVVNGIGKYIDRYASRHFANNMAKCHAVEQLCHDASSHHANNDSENLAQLLDDQLVGIRKDLIAEPNSLSIMKDVDVAKRFGDVVFLPPTAEIIVVGDSHGDLASTKKIITKICKSGLIASGGFVVFLGDYVNNGVKSWQNLKAILSFQQKHPKSVVLLSGNHEFKESYITACNEYLNVHWDRFSVDELPVHMQGRLPQFNNHYGHMRLDLVREFGFEEGERLYSKCFDWGLGLPCICVSGDLMISHSLGKLEGHDLDLPNLLTCKQDDITNLQSLGYETWSARRPSLHSALINNRTMTTDLIDEFSRVLDVDNFVVGHCHYRSGDTLEFGRQTLTTIVSSEPYSTDSGHYMYQQMVVERTKKRDEENLSQHDAKAGYLTFATNRVDQAKRQMTLNNIF